MWQRLVRLHRWNGWNLLLLFVTGILLFTPAVRVHLAPVRFALKWLHIGAGIASLLFLVLYLADAAPHWLKLGRRIGQRLNLLLMGALLIGWGLTGVVLWFHASLPPAWANLSLLWHDRLTWFAIPWVVGHSLTRYLKVRLLPVTTELDGRRAFLAGAGAFVGALLWRRAGQAAGFPGMEGPLIESHAPVGPDFKPPAVGQAPPATATAGADPAESTAHPGSTWNGRPGERPPGRQGRFRIYSVTDPMPTIKREEWRLTVDGLVQRPLALDYASFTGMAGVTSQVSDFHCVTGWSVWGVTWTGVPLRELLLQAGVRAGATWVKFYSGDGLYTSAVPLEVAVQEDVMVAYQIDGAPLPGPLGGPVRLVVPNLYAWKSVKWLERIELIPEEHIGFWEERGYPNDARIQT